MMTTGRCTLSDCDGGCSDATCAAHLQRDKEEITARRTAATLAFRNRAHNLYHGRNGNTAPCHNCGNIARSSKGFQL